MKVASIRNMVRGWFIGPFTPTLLQTEQFECAVKRYKAGERESAHVHRVATEFTVIGSGRVRMNGREFLADDVIEIPPGYATDFEALEDTVTFVVKVPAVAGDKFGVAHA